MWVNASAAQQAELHTLSHNKKHIFFTKVGFDQILVVKAKCGSVFTPFCAQSSLVRVQIAIFDVLFRGEVRVLGSLCTH